MHSNSVNNFFIRNKVVFMMGVSALIIAGTADLFAGLLLNSMEEYLLLIPGMMILIYCAIGMRGNIFGAMGSRLGTSMHMGTFQANFKKGGVLRANIDSAICLTMTLSIIMGAVIWAVAKYLFEGTYSVWDFIFISTLGGILSGLIVMGFNIVIAKEGFKRDWDVDNITAPLIAAIGDIVTMPMIFLSAWLLLSVKGTELGETAIESMALSFIVITAVYAVSIMIRKVSKRDFSGEAKRIMKDSLPILLLCILFEIGAGMVIQNEEQRLLEYAVLLIMLPAFLNQGNALSGMLTSRLSSMIHLGTMKSKRFPPSEALENFGIMYVCSILTFLYIGCIAFGASYMVNGAGGVGFVNTLLIITIAGILATTMLNFLSYYVAILATSFGLDPDDHCIPVTSSVMDLAGALVLVLIIMIFI